MFGRFAVPMILFMTPAVAVAQQLPSTAVVVTSGEGVVQAVPDRAWITVTAESRASNPREAQRRNAEAMLPVQQKLQAAGIAANAIRTIGYDLQQEWDFVNNRRVSRGYVARNTIEVRVDAIERAAEVLDIAVESGATALGGIRFDLKDRAALEREALKLAVQDARARADAAAAGAGRSVERIVRVEEQGIPVRPPIAFAAVREAQAADAPPISAGQIEVRAQVTLTVEVK